MARMKAYLENKIALARSQGRSWVNTLRLTPGQYAELAKDLGREPTTLASCNGIHPVEKIECKTQATGDNVILCSRDDLFSETDSALGIQMVSTANSVTSVPDNIGVCEVVSVGELVTDLKPGDIAFIDFYDVKQGYVVSNEELYISSQDAFRAKFDPVRQEVLPLDNYVVTRRANNRMKVALNGSDTFDLPPCILTDGISGGKNSTGATSTHILYQEVVSIGRLSKRPRPGLMTPREARFLQLVASKDPEVQLPVALEELRQEQVFGRRPDFNPGDLVVFCKEIGTAIRVRGEFQTIIPYDNVLAVIDDAAILAESIAKGRSNLIKVA
jgi:hypothetical protein